MSTPPPPPWELNLPKTAMFLLASPRTCPRSGHLPHDVGFQMFIAIVPMPLLFSPVLVVRLFGALNLHSSRTLWSPIFIRVVTVLPISLTILFSLLRGTWFASTLRDSPPCPPSCLLCPTARVAVGALFFPFIFFQRFFPFSTCPLPPNVNFTGRSRMLSHSHWFFFSRFVLFHCAVSVSPLKFKSTIQDE